MTAAQTLALRALETEAPDTITSRLLAIYLSPWEMARLLEHARRDRQPLEQPIAALPAATRRWLTEQLSQPPTQPTTDPHTDPGPQQGPGPLVWRAPPRP